MHKVHTIRLLIAALLTTLFACDRAETIPWDQPEFSMCLSSPELQNCRTFVFVKKNRMIIPRSEYARSEFGTHQHGEATVVAELAVIKAYPETLVIQIEQNPQYQLDHEVKLKLSVSQSGNLLGERQAILVGPDNPVAFNLGTLNRTEPYPQTVNWTTEDTKTNYRAAPKSSPD